MNLPRNYTLLEYIESTGIQHIDTGFKPNQNSRVTLEFESAAKPAGWACVFGTANGTSSNANLDSFAVWQDASANTYGYYYGDDHANAPQNVTIVGRHSADCNKNVMTIDDTTVSRVLENFTCRRNLILFATNRMGTVDYNAKIKLFSAKIYDSGVLIRNYIPCTNESGAVGLYDTVSAKFYGNNGTGSFVKGPEIVNVTTITGIPDSYGIRKEKFTIAGTVEDTYESNAIAVSLHIDDAEISTQEVASGSQVSWEVDPTGYEEGMHIIKVVAGGVEKLSNFICESVVLEWIDPIFDRTETDIESVKALIMEIKEVGWNNLDADSRNYFLGEIRGTFSKVTYERILNNIQYLSQRLIRYGYNPKVYKQPMTYEFSDIPTLNDIEKTVQNLKSIVDCFYDITVELPDDVNYLDIIKVNAMEQSLYDVDRYLSRTDGNNLRCGTVNCNQTVVGGLRWRIG